MGTCEARFPQLLKLTEVPLLLRDVPLSTFVSVGCALGRDAKGMKGSGLGPRDWDLGGYGGQTLVSIQFYSLGVEAFGV